MQVLINDGIVVDVSLSDAATLTQSPQGCLLADAGDTTYIALPEQPVLAANATGAPPDAPPSCFSFVAGSVLFDQNVYDGLIAVAIATKLKELEAYGLAKEQGGTTVNGFLYDTDDKTQAKLGNAYQLAGTASSPDAFSWWMSRGFVSIPKEQILSDAPVVAAFVEEVFSVLGTHYAAIEALTSLSAIDGYDFKAGWPTGT